MLRRAIVALALAGLLAGCAVSVPKGSLPSAPAATARTAAEALTDLASGLAAALSSGDHEAFPALFDAEADQARLKMLAANLRQGETTVRISGNRLAVGWQVPGDSGPGWHHLAVPMRCDPDCLPLDLVSPPDEPAASWSLAPLRVNQSGRVTVIMVDQSRDLTSAAAAAADYLVSVGLPDLFAGWNGRLVVEVPANRDHFRAVLGDSGGLSDATGALTVRADHAAAEGAAAAVRVLVNLHATAATPAAAMSFLLVHEGVHVATWTLGAPAPGRLWVSEGLSDALALAGPGAELTTASVAVTQACQGLPATTVDDDLRGNLDPQLAARAYGVAAGRVRALLDHGGAVTGASDLKALWQGEMPAGMTEAQLLAMHQEWCAKQPS